MTTIRIGNDDYKPMVIPQESPKKLGHKHFVLLGGNRASCASPERLWTAVYFEIAAGAL
jgi:hypothetical protein